MAPLRGMPPCGRGVPSFFHPCMWKPPGSVGATFMSPACVRCCARVRAVVSRRCLPLCSCAGRHKWRPYGVCRRAVVVFRRFFIRACGNRRVCHRAVVMSRRFFIRACGNRRQRRGDIHVARVRAPLRCVCVRHVRSVGLCRSRVRRRVSSVLASPLLYRAS